MFEKLLALLERYVVAQEGLAQSLVKLANPVMFVEQVDTEGILLERPPTGKDPVVETTAEDPATWDRNLTTLALVTKVNSYFSIKLEYYLLNEVTGGSVSVDAGTGEEIDNATVKDNQFLLQTTFEF